VAAFKTLLIETLQGQSSAMLLDPHFAIPEGHRQAFADQRG
jgi:tagatose 1,6-diphosphate aldolase